MQKIFFLMQFLIFFCYELIVCPLIFKSNKVYFASSLIAKPNYHHCQQSIRLYTLHSESDSKSESNESQCESVNFIEKNSPKK